jgi:hypothetical protein
MGRARSVMSEGTIRVKKELLRESGGLYLLDRCPPSYGKIMCLRKAERGQRPKFPAGSRVQEGVIASA